MIIEGMLVGMGAPAAVVGALSWLIGGLVWLVKWAFINPILAGVVFVAGWITKAAISAWLWTRIWRGIRAPFRWARRRWLLRAANVRRCAARMSNARLSAKQRSHAAWVVAMSREQGNATH